MTLGLLNGLNCPESLYFQCSSSQYLWNVEVALLSFLTKQVSCDNRFDGSPLIWMLSKSKAFCVWVRITMVSSMILWGWGVVVLLVCFLILQNCKSPMEERHLPERPQGSPRPLSSSQQAVWRQKVVFILWLLVLGYQPLCSCASGRIVIVVFHGLMNMN